MMKLQQNKNTNCHILQQFLVTEENKKKINSTKRKIIKFHVKHNKMFLKISQ